MIDALATLFTALLVAFFVLLAAVGLLAVVAVVLFPIMFIWRVLTGNSSENSD